MLHGRWPPAAAGEAQGKDRAARAGAFSAAASLLQQPGGGGPSQAAAACQMVWLCSISPTAPENGARAFDAGFVQPACALAASAAAAAAAGTAPPDVHGCLNFALAALQAVTCHSEAAKAAAGAAGLMETCTAVLKLAVPASRERVSRVEVIACVETASGIIGNCCYDADGVENARRAGEAGAAQELLRLAGTFAQNAVLLRALASALKGLTYKEVREQDYHNRMCADVWKSTGRLEMSAWPIRCLLRG